jgi:hypothetical protein
MLLAAAASVAHLLLHLHAGDQRGAAALLAGTFGCTVAAFACRDALPPPLATLLASRELALAVWALTAAVCAANVAAYSASLAAVCTADSVCPLVLARERPAFWVIILPLGSLPWLIAGLPLRLVWLPDALRCGAYAFAALHAAGAAGTLAPSLAAAVLAEATACALLTAFVLSACYAPPEDVTTLLAAVETCPPPLRRMRDAVVGAGERFRAHAFLGAPLLDANGTAIIVLHLLYLVWQVCDGPASATTLLTDAARLSSTVALVLAGSVAAKLRRMTSPLLGARSQAFEVARDSSLLKQLRDRLSTALSEADILAATAESLGALFPDSIASAVGAFAEGAACDIVAAVEVTARSEASRVALADALPPDVGACWPAAFAVDAPETSVARACRDDALGCPRLLDSHELAGGVAACADWAAAAAAGLSSSRCITAPLTAGSAVVGFATLAIGVYAAPNVHLAALRELCDLAGAAIFVRRAFALMNRDGGRAPQQRPSASATVMQHRKSFGLGGDALEPEAYPASEADATALEALDANAAEDKELLLRWSLDAWALPDDEVQRLLVASFHALGLLRAFRISPTAFAAFVADVAEHYNGA